MLNFVTLSLLFFLPFSFQLPVPDNQPELLRQARESDSSLELGNISAPSYIVDEFKNLTRNLTKSPTRRPPRNNEDLVNAVRYFPNIAEGQECGVSFNISAINSDEFVIKSILRVHIERSRFQGDIVAYLKHQNGSNITDIIVKGEWAEFKIAPIIDVWVKKRTPGPHNFTVVLASGGSFLSCGPQVTITTSTRDLNLQPLLVVHSMDPNIDDNPLVKGMRQLMNSSQKEKRSLTERTEPTVIVPTPSPTPKPEIPCKTHKVYVTMDWLNELVVDSGSIIGPAKYNAGICGGTCRLDVPRAPQHAVIHHLLVTGRNGGSPKIPRDDYEKCCVPVKYGHMNFLMVKDGVYSMWKLENSVVKECGCIYTKKH